MAQTGPIAESSVSSRTFSIADFEGSMGGGFTRVGLSAISAAGFDIKCLLGWEMRIVGAIRSWIDLI